MGDHFSQISLERPTVRETLISKLRNIYEGLLEITLIVGFIPMFPIGMKPHRRWLTQLPKFVKSFMSASVQSRMANCGPNTCINMQAIRNVKKRNIELNSRYLLFFQFENTVGSEFFISYFVPRMVIPSLPTLTIFNCVRCFVTLCSSFVVRLVL